MDVAVEAAADNPLQKLIIDTIPAQVWIAAPDGAMKFVNRHEIESSFSRSSPITCRWPPVIASNYSR